ncbi:MAG: hypothetical protein WCH74_10075 [Chloroflexota bacterium]
MHQPLAIVREGRVHVRRALAVILVPVLVASGLALAPAGTLSATPVATQAAAATFPIPAIPIPNQVGAAAVQEYIGQPATAHAVSATAIPPNPFTAPAPWSILHNDSYQSDTYPGAGPLGRSPSVVSTFLGTPADPVALTVGVTFDSSGNLVAGAIKVDTTDLVATVRLTLLDPHTLAQLAAIDLPSEQLKNSTDRVSGAYFYSDEHDRTIIGTVDRTIWVVSHAQAGGVWTFSHDPKQDIDLTSVIAEGDKIQALQPDYAGHIWVTTKYGTVCTVDADTGALLGVSDDIGALGEEIANGTAAASDDGVFIASTNAMYRFDADEFGRPWITWRAVFGTGDRIKPGQIALGTGTTPTLMGSQYVAIADNADPYMNVLVYKRAKTVSGPRLVAKVPVFGAYRGSTENSLVATEKSIVVENNYGYRSNEEYTTEGRTTTPGLVRIDLDSKGKASTVWTNSTIVIPSVVTKMSLKNGLIYTYTKPAGPGTTDRWYFTAVDFRTGKVVWSQLAGTGFLYDNNYAPVYLGPDGTLYAGVNGGIVAMRDTN